MQQIMDLTRLKTGETGLVKEIAGGWGVTSRLETLGIRSNVHLNKISSQLARGPVTVQVGNTRVAIGFGMAEKIIVQLVRPDNEEQQE